MITGRYPHNHGAPELHTVLPLEQVTFRNCSGMPGIIRYYRQEPHRQYDVPLILSPQARAPQGGGMGISAARPPKGINRFSAGLPPPMRTGTGSLVKMRPSTHRRPLPCLRISMTDRRPGGFAVIIMKSAGWTILPVLCARNWSVKAYWITPIWFSAPTMGALSAL